MYVPFATTADDDQPETIGQDDTTPLTLAKVSFLPPIFIKDVFNFSDLLSEFTKLTSSIRYILSNLSFYLYLYF